MRQKYKFKKTNFIISKQPFFYGQDKTKIKFDLSEKNLNLKGIVVITLQGGWLINIYNAKVILKYEYNNTFIFNVTRSCGHRSPGVEHLDPVLRGGPGVLGQEGSGALFLSTQVSGQGEVNHYIYTLE